VGDAFAASDGGAGFCIFALLVWGVWLVVGRGGEDGSPGWVGAGFEVGFQGVDASDDAGFEGVDAGGDGAGVLGHGLAPWRGG